MYDIALMAAACVRAGTRVDVAWLVAAEGVGDVDLSDALALTPGGGRTGNLLKGALDSRLSDVLPGLADHGRLLDVEVSDVEALIAGLPGAGRATVLVVPARQLPLEVWPLLDTRTPLCLVCRLDGDQVTDIEVHTADTVGAAGADAELLLAGGVSAASRTADEVVSVFAPVPTLVVVGGGPNVAAFERAAPLLGWKCRRATDLPSAKGLVTALAGPDSLVVTAHDPDLAGAVVDSALGTAVGYIGVLGGRRGQQQVVDWLAYREVTDLSRVHGPAGLDIGAATPAEIALAVLAEAVSVHRARSSDT